VGVWHCPIEGNNETTQVRARKSAVFIGPPSRNEAISRIRQARAKTTFLKPSITPSLKGTQNMLQGEGGQHTVAIGKASELNLSSGIRIKALYFVILPPHHPLISPVATQ
jgi:hypothetical protein